MPTCAPSLRLDRRCIRPTLADTGEFSWPPTDTDLRKVSVLDSAGTLVHAEDTQEIVPARFARATSGAERTPAAGPMFVPVTPVREQARPSSPPNDASHRRWKAVRATGWILLVAAVVPGATVLGAFLGTQAARGRTTRAPSPPLASHALPFENLPSTAAPSLMPAAVPASSPVAAAPTVGTASVEPARPVAGGSLRIETTPAGYAVMIAGIARGRTPLVVSSLAAGIHDVQLAGPRGVVRLKATVVAGSEAELLWPRPSPGAVQSAAGAPPLIRAGWLVARSPFELRILEAGRVVGTTLAERTLLTAGTHALEFVNDARRLRFTREVHVTADGTTTVDLGRR